LLKKGESALKAGDQESARIAFEKAAELGSAEAHFALAYKFVNSPEQSAYHFAEAAKRGHQEALDRALDKLFFMARNLMVGNPKEALEVYRLAVNANAAVRWPRYRNIDTVRKCAEAGAFDADAFIDAHGLAQEHDTSYLGFYHVWELAEDAAAGGRFGPPNAELVLHLVCRGGVVPAEVEFAVSTVHAQWKAGKAPDFNICNNVSSRIGIGYCSGRHDLEVAERLSQLSYPEVTDNIWIVNETNILPTCLETVWASGDNYEEYEDQFPSAKDFYDHPGKYWGRVVPISALRTDWAPPHDMISIPQRVQNCNFLKGGQWVEIENNVATVKDPPNDPNSYRLIAEWGKEECDKVVPTFAGKCHSLVFVVIDNADAIYGRFYNTYAYITENGRDYILPITNGVDMGDFLELLSQS
jgi:hypothetical protein